MHGNGLLEILLVLLLAAVVAVPMFRKLGMGAVLGYMVAGLVVGPSGLGFVRDPASILAASEFGVVMLMFVIGLELSPQRLWVMRRPVFGAGALQLVPTSLLVAGGLMALHYGWRTALIAGIALALSSTALALRLLSERKELTTDHGRLSFAILLFQDLAAIPLLAVIPLLGNVGRGDAVPFWHMAVNAAVVILAIVIGGRYLLRPVFRAVAATKMVEVFSATALLIVAGTAWLMSQAGLSMALGGFLAGVLLADSEFRHELESHIEPFKGLLLGFFFTAVGMGLDVALLRSEPAAIAVGVAGLLLVKSLLLFAVGRLAGGLPWRSALMLGTTLATGGEFAFVVFGESHKAGLLDVALQDRLTLIVGLSMALTPLSLMALDHWLRQLPAPSEKPEYDAIDHEQPRVIIAGFGRVGQIIGRMLTAQKIPFTALENSQEQVALSRRFGNKIYFGDPARPELLRAAHADRAEIFVLSTDDPETNLRTARLVKRMYPHLKIFARARNRQHLFRLMDLSVHSVTRETFLSSLDMGRQVLEALGVPPEQAKERTERFRRHDEALLHEQYLVYDDDAALVASSQEALRELETLFEADATRPEGE